jgi:HK97 family phage portal protein
MRKERMRVGATPTGFRPLDWRTLEPKEIEPGSGDLDYWKRSQAGKDPEVIDVDDLVHFAWHAPAGVLGVSPLKQLGVSLRIEKAAQAYQEALFRNSARPSGGVTLPESVAGDREFRKELRSDLATLHQGVDNAGRPVILPPGSKWEQFSITAHEAELIEQRKVGREEAAAIYNAPQPLIGILDHATYSNIAELHKILYGPVLGPWIKLGEETFNAQVIAHEPAFAGQFVEFDLSEELRGDVVKEAAALRMQMQSGILTINEARQIKNLPKIDHPDCDRVMVPTNNMTFVGGSTPDNDDPAAQALSHHLQRVGNHLWRKARAGEDGWNAERFERELTEDLDVAGAVDPARAAKAWTGAIGAIVEDALNEPETLRAAFAALSIEIGGEG